MLSSFFGWLPRRSGATPASAESAPVVPDLLEQARALARAGKQREASETYKQIKRKHRTAAGLVEHAEILFQLGDYFGAASTAYDALRLEPENAGAKKVQDRIRSAEEAERRR